MLLAPAETTAIRVRVNWRRSGEMSSVRVAPRCTPPMPAVAKTSIPARSAMTIVPATVVAPTPPPATAAPRSRALSFWTCSALRIRSI